MACCFPCTSSSEHPQRIQLWQHGGRRSLTPFLLGMVKNSTRLSYSLREISGWSETPDPQPWRASCVAGLRQSLNCGRQRTYADVDQKEE
jgi:hypothetical protein